MPFWLTNFLIWFVHNPKNFDLINRVVIAWRSNTENSSVSYIFVLMNSLGIFKHLKEAQNIEWNETFHKCTSRDRTTVRFETRGVKIFPALYAGNLVYDVRIKLWKDSPWYFGTTLLPNRFDWYQKQIFSPIMYSVIKKLRCSISFIFKWSHSQSVTHQPISRSRLLKNGCNHLGRTVCSLETYTAMAHWSQGQSWIS